MADAAFKLGTFSDGGAPFPGLVLGEEVANLSAMKKGGSVLELLQDWQRNFEMLQRLAPSLDRAAMKQLSALRVLPPVMRPSKMIYAAANYKEHVKEMRASNFTGGVFDKSKDAQSADPSKLRPYCFFKAPSCLSGAYDDIVLPPGEHRIDWEAELAVVIGRPGKNIPASKALDHVAGFMTTNDVSCRDLTWREDRPTIRSDWVAGKSFDTFAPTGPFFVPAAFVPHHDRLRVLLVVNGQTKQDGNTADMVFNTAQQIEYASRMLALEPGDLFATGTPSGVGQGRGEFLKAGDVVECEVEGLGRQRNRVVAGNANYQS